MERENQPVILRHIVDSESLTVALFDWNNSWGDAYKQQCVRTICGNPALILSKKESGQPYSTNSKIGISLSHTQNLLAVSVSDQHQPGVDIEQIREKVKTIAPRVFSKEELDSISTFPELQSLHILWGAKEAVYKSYGNRGLIFKTEIQIAPFEFRPEGGNLNAMIRQKDFEMYAQLRYLITPEELVVVYTTAATVLSD